MLPNLVLPKIETEAIAERDGRFVIGPLESGYGVTVGNSLRRVLLASLPGAAITSVKVDGVYHEFSPIPGVKEDTPGTQQSPAGVRTEDDRGGEE